VSDHTLENLSESDVDCGRGIRRFGEMRLDGNSNKWSMLN
jgi:hypothetical protein